MCSSIYPDGSVYFLGWALLTLVRGAGHAALTRVWPSNPFSAAYHSQGGNDAVREVGWLSGACLALPAPVWRELGGFDEGYFMFFEDVDLGARVARAGWRNVQVPAAIVVHEQGASWKARPERMIRAHHASARRYLDGVYSAPCLDPTESDPERRTLFLERKICLTERGYWHAHFICHHLGRNPGRHIQPHRRRRHWSCGFHGHYDCS